MRETYTNFDVRFFGGKYERSVLPKNYIKPIKTDMNTLQVTYSSKKLVIVDFRFSFIVDQKIPSFQQSLPRTGITPKIIIRSSRIKQNPDDVKTKEKRKSAAKPAEHTRENVK